MVTDQEIAQALDTVLRDPESNPTSLNAVVHQLESKLGFDLTHKVDLIRTQIQLFFRSYHAPQPLHHPHRDHFSVQNLNFTSHPSHFPPQFQNHPPVPKAEAASFQNVAVVKSEAPTESAPVKAKRKGGTGGLNKVCGVSPLLQTIVGHPALPRTEIVKQLWAYIRKNNLQDPSNKRKIICNDELRLVFETDCTDMFKMNKLLAKHIIPLEPSKKPSAKKVKAEVESGTKSSESGPYVIISDSLANFFGINGREMLQSEVIRRVWEYIKVNHLEDPLNSMTILCDAKLQELFGHERIPALGIPEILLRHHLFNRQ